MELLRTLGSLIEPPGEETVRLAALLELGPAPAPAAYTELLVLQLYPFASVYLDSEGKLGGEARDRIGGFWRALGLNPPTEPDHLTLQLSFYSHLQELESAARLTEDRARWHHVRLAFLWEHLLSWLPVYLVKMSDVNHDFYRRWATLLVEVLADEIAGHPLPDQLPLHLRTAPPLVDPRPEDQGEEFLASLLCPVRSGMILVRADLERAGRELGLGVRSGERAYVLKALLGQDDRATLQWLGEEAVRWAERHQTRALEVGAINQFWAARAASTAALLADLSSNL
jgi:TorA maturation chaperone TorD